MSKKEETEDVIIDLVHCGHFEIDEDKINGWFHPIPLSLWEEIVGFHKSMSIETKSETVSYHRWNPETEEYDTIIPYQVTSRGGLSVDTDWEAEENVALLDEYAEKWGTEFFPACTIHTHVDVAAFESGTDAADEEDLPGWHVTLGHLGKGRKEMDIDFRFRLPKLKKVKELTTVEDKYDLPIEHLFEEGVLAEEISQCPWDNTNFNEYKERVSFHQRQPAKGIRGIAK